MPDPSVPSSSAKAPAMPAGEPPPGALATAAATAPALQQAQQQQPDGPNVAPSPWERTAAQGVLPDPVPPGGVPAPRVAAAEPPSSDPTQGENVP